MEIECLLHHKKGVNDINSKNNAINAADFFTYTDFSMMVHLFPPFLQGIIFDDSYQNQAEELLKSLMKQTGAEGYILQNNRPFTVLASRNIPETSFVCTEQGIRYYVQLGNRQNAGLFPDTSLLRKWLLEHAKNANILNLFSYTCGFSVAAAKGGAKTIVNLDMNSPVLNTGRENHRINNVMHRGIEFHKKNVLKSWPLFKRKGPFDIIICDPPPAQKGGFMTASDYPRLIRRLPEFLAPDGSVILTLNDYRLDEGFLNEHCRNAGLKEVETIPLPGSYSHRDILIKRYTPGFLG